MSETATRRGFLDFSPVKRDYGNKENDVPTLRLIQFSKAPFLTFGTVKLGTCRSTVLQIENPTEDVEAEVTVEKIPSNKGFSVDHSTFTIQPEGSFCLTVTWTPTEEGGMRELIIFNANGVLKHQAVMLGRAEAPKKKKKSLWDSIKNKTGSNQVAAPRRKVTDQPLKMASNKAFQVSRKPQYQRKKSRSPLASLDEGRPEAERPFSKQIPQTSLQQKVLNSQSEENIYNMRRKSLHDPKLDGNRVSLSPDGMVSKPENQDLISMLNKTLSPIGTPARLKKLMPHIYHESPLSAAVRPAASLDEADERATGTPILSVKEALALIDSDLSHINSSPQDTSSSCGFSDSLESKSGSHGCKVDNDFLKALQDSPHQPDACEQRLTFFVTKKGVSEVAGSEPIQKAAFTSVTVTKAKAPVEANSLSGRKIRKSKRRLLEKTLELSGSSESGPGTPSLPVIDVDAGTEACHDAQPQELSTSILCPRIQSLPTTISSPVASPLAVPSGLTSPFPVNTSILPSSPVGTSSPLHPKLCVKFSMNEVCPPASEPPPVQEDSFPVHMALKNKKRKSEEFLKSDEKIEDAGKTELAKRTRVVVCKPEPCRPARKSSERSTATPSLRSVQAAGANPSKPPGSRFPSRGPQSSKSSRAASVKTSKIVAVAQSKLSFIKPTQNAIPRHPMPFAAKNMFYDERWIEKQQQGFTCWMNYVLTPDDFKVNTEVAKVNAVSIVMGGGEDKFSVPKAPTKEEMSFSTYTARRKLNRLRRAACQLFTSDAMVKAIQRLELEVEAKRLLVRKDRHLWKDIGERKKVLNWLLSYNPLWLRIGLETIYGELISLESNSDVLGLAMFILQRLLWNPDIAAEFRHTKVPHLYKDGHEEALSRFTLKKLLLLVCFLDRAKESRLIEHNPCLFCLDAEFKATKDLLLAFSRDFLSGEGILPRHLGYLGLPVSHVQTPLDEFNFAVKSLAVDLKCGIRLVRVMELLMQDWSFSAKLRLPAISRLQKIHNVDVALQVLKDKGVDLKDDQGNIINSRDIVDGHREKTLNLLWKIIFAFQVDVMLDENQLREEISFLRRTLRTKQRLALMRANQNLQLSSRPTSRPHEHSSVKISLLMDWVRAVCDFYKVKVENFTVSFSDGRVLCYLIHHYHPSLLSDKAVSLLTTQTVECSLRGRLELDCSASESDNSFDSLPAGLNGPDSQSVEFKELLENEKSNFRLINTAVSFLGGVPAMINPSDMSNTIPNEKVVVLYLSFLCARLLNLRNETRAARVIQTAWRKYRLNKDLQLYKERNMAAVKIQKCVRNFLQKCRDKKQNQAAVVIQAVWRGHAVRNGIKREKRARLQASQHKAATVIQAHWRTFMALKAFQKLRYYTIILQAQWRMRRASSAYGKLYWATTIIQTHWRARVLAKHDREYYCLLRAAVVKLQRGYRRWQLIKTQKENHAAKVIQTVFKKWFKERMDARTTAAVRIQSWYRMQKCHVQYKKVQLSVVLIQARYRGGAQRQRFELLKLQHHSAVVIQRAFRGHAVRKRVAKMKRAALIIQLWFRACVVRDVQRQTFVELRAAAITVQAAYRGKLARESLKKQHGAATVIQAALRKYAARRRYLLLKKAATVVQQKYRATALARDTKKEYDAFRKAALTIQANWRGRADRKKMEKQHQCATLIKAHYRRYKAQAEYRSKRAAAVVIQRYYRGYMAGKRIRNAYLRMRAACITVQAGFRGMIVRAELKKQHRAATVIQTSVRMFLCKKQYLLLQSAAVIIQRRYRALILGRTQQNKHRRLKQATVKIQAVYRGFRVREELKKRHVAARAIQTQFRMHRMRVAYLATKYAAILIQERYRAKKLRDQQRRTYTTMKAAAGVIQAAYRGYRARREIAEMHQAATVIQRRFFSIRERNKFLAIKTAVLFCQQRYRAVVMMRKVRSDYLSKRRAVISLQAACRGYLVRRHLRIQQTAAVTIQSWFRKNQQRTYYQRLQWAASVMQERYRSNKIMKQEMLLLNAKKRAAVTLQAAFRGMKCRRNLKRMHQAAHVIQRVYRACCQRKQYLALRSSVLIIQRRYRATVAAKGEVKLYQRMRRAAVLLQAAFRGHRARKEVARWHQAATVIQSAFRSHRQQTKFQALRLSAVIIQRCYRSHVLLRKERETFLKKRSSALVLQAAFRGHRVRRSISNMHRAATVIQAHFRRYQAQAAFGRKRWAACVFQQRFRAQRQKNVEVQRYQQLRKAAIVFQAAYRGMKCRNTIKERHQASRVIQRAFRAHCQHKQYLALRSSVLIIQRRYRATMAAKGEVKLYQRMRRAAVLLQAAFRGQRARKEVARWHQAATVIQSAFRSHRQQIKFQALRLSAVIIQRCYRSHVLLRKERETFLKKRSSALVLQAAFRGHRVRRSISNMHRAATVIQAHFRRYQAQAAFGRKRWAACVFQQRFRAQRQKNVEVQRYQQLRKAAIVFQAAYRGMKCRNTIKERHQASRVIQRAFRAHCQHKQYLALRSSVLIIQRRYRATMAAKGEVKLYQRMRRAAVLLQAAFRGQRARKEVARWHQAATVIQSAFRSHRQQTKFQALRLSAVIIQRCYRSHVLLRKERETFLKKRSSALVLQAAFRGHRVRRSISNMHRAASVIQAHFRRYQAQAAFGRKRWAACVFQQRFRAQRQKNVEVQRYQDVRRAVLSLQAGYRRMKSRRVVKERQHAASVLQRAYRAHLHHKRYLRLRSCAVAIQRRYRATAAAKAERFQYLEMRSSAIIIQAAFRRQQVRKEMDRRHQAATVIQSAFRGHREEARFQALRLSIITIQRCYRAHILQRRDREKFLKMKWCTTTLQAAYRGWCVRRDVCRQHRAATRIQSCWRGSMQRRTFQRKRAAAVTLQQRVRAVQRGRLERKKFTQMRQAAIVIQQYCRVWTARQQAFETEKAAKRLRFTSAVFHHLCAMKLQRALRAHWALKSAKNQIQSVIVIQRWVKAKQQRRRYLEDRQKVVVAQRAAQRWLRRRNKAASTIQQAVRKFLLLRRQKKFERGIIKAQALWRGHRSRRLNEDLKVVKLRQRLRQLSANVREEDRLGNKTSSALDYLLRYKHFSYILEALKNLETATRLSPVCCERLVESGATVVIFTLIRSCNRSVPCMEVITSSIQILLNLSKYHKTIEAVYSVENSVEILLDLLQRYREKAGDKVAEKGGSIFTKACFLLALLLQERHRAAEVMNLPKVLERIRSIYRLTARKHKKDAERTFVKQKMNASISGSFFVQATPRRSRLLPKFAPDWVLRKDKLKDIVDPLRAIQMVAHTLSVEL
ncbi:abnormal spindle-like microcephaly-associated protein isoform X2 [Takifugu rubripes]|uniref:abnormal spindle-like microcephaly-associated protein isoform X2 n=1 Tax=Takifugu rubripes TaxID=31033 RepID=UPI00114542DC|nr:abnormal spindle-like microcephaly-associated protein isoform X2 [Takifugu rubripes]